MGPLGTNWNFNQIYNIFIQENAFESIVCEMAAILSRPQTINAGLADDLPLSKPGLICTVCLNADMTKDKSDMLLC